MGGDACVMGLGSQIGVQSVHRQKSFKLCLCLIMHHAMKTYGVVEV
jgi:hypothetical protein